MPGIKKTIVIAAALVPALILTGSGPGRGQESGSQTDYLIRASQLLNRSVKFVGEDRTGEINELYVDPVTGFIPFSILRFHAVFGIVERSYLLSIPWPYVQFDCKNRQFIIGKARTEDGAETSLLPFKPEIHKAIEPPEAARIFEHYHLENLLAQKRERTDTEPEVPVVQSIRLTNIPVRSRGMVLGRVEQYFVDLESGMVRMVLINSRKRSLTEDFILLPFPLLEFESSEFAYILTIPEERLSHAPGFSDFLKLYYPMEEAAEVYRKFGLIEFPAP